MMKDKVVNGPQNATHRSLYHALGLTEEEQQRPLIAVVSSYNEIVPGHMNLDKLVDAVKNRDGTGVCPMEQCVAEIDDADKAVCALRKRISELQQQSRANIINKIAKK